MKQVKVFKNGKMYEYGVETSQFASAKEKASFQYLVSGIAAEVDGVEMIVLPAKKLREARAELQKRGVRETANKPVAVDGLVASHFTFVHDEDGVGGYQLNSRLGSDAWRTVARFMRRKEDYFGNVMWLTDNPEAVATALVDGGYWK